MLSGNRAILYILGLLMFVFASSLSGQPVVGDCNGDETVNASDIAYITNYLEGIYPIPPSSCDCDGSPGINIADAMQIEASVFADAELYAPPGYDVPIQSGVKIFCNKQVDGTVDNQSIPIYIDVPLDTEIEAFWLPFAYSAGNGQAELICDSISFDGTVVAGVDHYFDNTKKILTVNSNASTPVIPSGTSGLLCTAWFSQAAPGDNNDLILTNDGRYWPMLLRKRYYEGVDGERIMFPEFIRARYGDVNTDGFANVSDAVWIVNYIFIDGPAPGANEP
jgi:hypothetical protein